MLKRWLKRISILFVMILSSALVVFGAFKYSERQALSSAKNHLEKSEPYEALKVFKDFEKLRFNRLALDYGFVDPLWHYNYGLALLRVSDYAGAAREFDRAVSDLKDDKEKSLAYFNLGEARLWQWDGGAFEEAALLYQEALKHNPELVIAKKRLEWLRLANLIKGEMSGDPKDKNAGRPKDGQPEDKKDEGQGNDEKFKQTEGKRRRGY